MSFFSPSQKIALARSLLTKTSPAYVQFYITARCNMACEQCNIIYANADAAELTTDQIRQVARNLAEIGVGIVLLIGGEPFVRKDIVEIIQAFTDVGIHVRMQTNGIATKETLIKCVAAGAHDISISLDSLSDSLQEKINGGIPRSWQRAINTVSTINEIFPENGSAFFGTVLMPKNMYHIPDVVEFATEIGWGVSLVPAHVSTPDRPQGFRTFDDSGTCKFQPELFPEVRRVLDDVKALREKGLNVYDSDEYLDDVYRFIAGEPLRWRRRNENVCDSPNLYFAIEPNGNVSPCCDFKLDKEFPTHHPDFPKWYADRLIHREVYKFTRNCAGCMYGSYPEITVTARYMDAFLKRFLYFNRALPKLNKLSADQMTKLANDIFRKNEVSRSPLRPSPANVDHGGVTL